MHILVTRPAEDAAPLAERLAAAGHRVTIAPLMTIRPLAGPAPDLTGVQAILFTSANGVRAFCARSAARDHPVLAVGDATARAAREAGFRDVVAADGDVHSLAALIARRLDPARGALFHGAGQVIAGDLAVLLAPHGFTVRRETLYEAVAADRLPDTAREALRSDVLDAVLFYSPRTARIFAEMIFADLATRADITGHLGRLIAGALSPAVAKALESGPWALQSNPWQRIVIAAEPTEAALLAALGLVHPA